MSFSFVFTFIVTPIMVFRLGIEEFGLWNVCNAFLGMLGIFNFGLGDTAIKFIAEYQTRNDFKGINGIISSVSVLNFGIALLIFFPLYKFIPLIANLFPVESVTNTQIQQTLRITLLGFIPVMVRNIMIAIPKGFQDYKTVALFGILVNFISSSLVVILVLLGGSVNEVVIGAVVVSWVSCFASILIVYLKFSRIGVPFRFDLQEDYLKKVLNFSVFVGLTGIGNAIFSVFDRLTVGVILGLSAVGFYSIAIGVANKLPTIGSALTQSLFPAFSAWKEKYDTKEILRRLIYSSAVVSIPIIFLVILLIVFSQPLLILWLGEKTAMSVLSPFRILILIYLIAPCVAPSFQAASGLGYPWINTISTWLMGSLTILLIIYWGPSLGVIGAALANGSMLFLLLVPILVVYKLLSTLPKHDQPVEL